MLVVYCIANRFISGSCGAMLCVILAHSDIMRPSTFYKFVAVAAGMMIAASYSLIAEGCTFEEPEDTSEISSSMRTLIGGVLGLCFIVGTKRFLEQHEEYHIGDLAGADFRRIMLIIFVMTLHSFSEGVGIGVSFGGENGSELGVFISASLAVHNVPEDWLWQSLSCPRGYICLRRLCGASALVFRNH